MKLNNGVIFIWTGTNAAIPAGWSRVTSLDDKYPKGTAASTNPDTTGGAATHTHTSPTHTHTETTGHTHQITISAGIGNTNQNSGTGGQLTSNHHTHGAAFASGAITSFSCQSVAVTYAAFSNNPPYYTVIYVTPTTTVTVIPAGVIGLADAAAPTGFAICDGTASTPNLVDKYLLGAAAGANAGTTGGTTTNVHAINHSHTTSHTHAAATSGSSSMNGLTNNVDIAQASHTHSVTPNAATPSLSDNFNLTTSETVEPAYTKLLAIQAAADIVLPKAIIALWLGTLANIPYGWELFSTMNSRHLKITGTVGSVGTTGGSNTHTHGSQNHTHAAVAHSHTVGNLSHAGGHSYNGGGNTNDDNTTYHTVSTDSVNLVTDAGATTADSSNNEPPYRTVAFIKSTFQSFTDPGNVYASDNAYATFAATSGDITIEVSKDAGVDWQTPHTKTFTGSDSLLTFGDGATETWGSSFTRADMVDSLFRVRISQGTTSEIYSGFGFTTGVDILTGIEVAVEAKYASATISIDLLEVKIHYGTSVLPVQAGSQAFASDGRKVGEGGGAGTGTLVYYDGNAWRRTGDDTTVAA